ncbi:hypothetical protein JMG10_29280 [Nostoc ellipsosporum NOK]|nr:hypothetical protein [Nostoc ellipsosporum NOK]
MREPEPFLRPVSIDALRPTQITVGFREVARKRHAWRARAGTDGSEFLGRHMIPAVRGPRDRFWIVDAHHLARALHDEGVEFVLVREIADLSALPGRAFRTFMDSRGWLHPYDPQGHRLDARHLPKHVRGLRDDPWRSLAGELRRSGGYAKDLTPYSEFLWADFLRRHVSAKLLEADFDKALERALALARRKRAAYLPGWAGPEN